MDNKMIYHMCGEAIVIAGLSAYFFKENRKLQEQIKELKSELDKQKKENDKVFGTIFNVLETHLNPRQISPEIPLQQQQEISQIQTIRKRNPPQQQRPGQRPERQQRLEQPPQQRPERQEPEPSQEDDLKEEMNALLQEDDPQQMESYPEEDVQTIDITDNDVKQDNGQVVVMMMSAIPPQ